MLRSDQVKVFIPRRVNGGERRREEIDVVRVDKTAFFVVVDKMELQLIASEMIVMSFNQFIVVPSPAQNFSIGPNKTSISLLLR